MLKNICLRIILPSALILLPGRASLSQSRPVDLSCYFQKADGTVLSLGHLCSQNLSTPRKMEDQHSGLDFTEEDNRKYEADLNDLKERRKEFPDTEALIKNICNLKGKCPSQAEIRNMSISF